MSQRLPVDHFKWIGKTSQLNEDFINSYKGDSDMGYFPEVCDNCMNFIMIYLFCLNK